MQLYNYDLNLRSDYRPSKQYIYHHLIISTPVSVHFKTQEQAEKQK